MGSYISLIALYWLVTALVGFVYTGRNVAIAITDYRILKGTVDPATEVAAFTPVRSHLLMLYLHGAFIPLGVLGLFAPPMPNQIVHSFLIGMTTAYVAWSESTPFFIITLAFLLTPPILITMSATIHTDRQKAQRLARRRG
jgi:hypothetical protein